MPVPPSLVADPPTLNSISVAPPSSAARMSSPTPNVSASSGRSGSSLTHGSPLASAASTIAVEPSALTP
ncbi:hypothetical protein SD72_10910 [Leucobacter komagatae]|uniref:Uncharacterized protein n=1 Tax=Leucobacter komagatae TaxID=55969 RepID=A0A0D0H4W0_9MICO|nr:hypothetical protein SD72_10910 [Leucobacter komagatae]